MSERGAKARATRSRPTVYVTGEKASPTPRMPALNPRMPRFAAALLALVAGCAAPTPAPRLPGGWTAACVLSPPMRTGTFAGGSDTSAPVRVSLPARIRPERAPAAAEPAERLVFGQLYQTLVQVDCEGRVRPGLAESWSHDDDGRRWSFTLRPDIRFWDGSPVTARSVARSWLSSGRSVRPRPGMPGIVSATVAGPLELTVLLREATTAPERFARPALAVTGDGYAGRWPLGSGPYRPLADGRDPEAVRLVARGSGDGALTFVPALSADGRAALDDGADVVASTDPAVIAYARALPGFGVTPLPWTRTYVLAAAQGAAWGLEAPPTAPFEALEGLARGAVRAEARPAEGPFWWREGGCEEGSAPERVSAARPGGDPPDPERRNLARVVYPLGDAVARGIAERLVALTSRGGAVPAWLETAIFDLATARGSTVTAGLDPATLARAVRGRNALAFIVPVPRAPGGGCLSALLAEEDPVAGAVLEPESGMRITPLVDVRASLVLRRGVTGIAIDGDGTLRFLPADDRPEGAGHP